MAAESLRPDAVQALLHYANVLESRDKALRRRLCVETLQRLAVTARHRKSVLTSALRTWSVNAKHAVESLPLQTSDTSVVADLQQEIVSLKEQLQGQRSKCEALEADLQRSVAVTKDLVLALQSSRAGGCGPVDLGERARLQHLVNHLNETVASQIARIDGEDTATAKHTKVMAAYKQDVLYCQAALQHQIDVSLDLASQLSAQKSQWMKRQGTVDRVYTSLVDLSLTATERTLTPEDFHSALESLRTLVSDTVHHKVQKHSRSHAAHGNNSVDYASDAKVKQLETELQEVGDQLAVAEAEVGQRGEEIDVLTERVSDLENRLELSQAEVWRLTEEVVDKMDALVAVKSQLRQYDVLTARLTARCVGYQAVVLAGGLQDFDEPLPTLEPPLQSLDNPHDKDSREDIDGSDDGTPRSAGVDMVTGAVESLAKILFSEGESQLPAHFEALQAMSALPSQPVSQSNEQLSRSSRLWHSRHGPITAIAEESGDDADE